jgi:hypothetical protein
MTTHVSEPDSIDICVSPHSQRGFGSELSPRFLRFFLRGAEPGRPVDSPSSWTARLHYWTVNPLGLHDYEARTTLSFTPRASWFTILYWQQLLDENRPEPWAPACLHIDLRKFSRYVVDQIREPVTV